MSGFLSQLLELNKGFTGAIIARIDEGCRLFCDMSGVSDAKGIHHEDVSIYTTDRVYAAQLAIELYQAAIRAQELRQPCLIYHQMFLQGDTN
jgi:hypothetical protein